MKEKIIVTLTSYGERLGNLPVVLDRIFNQSEKPDLVVLNLAFEESVPDEVMEYLKQHNVEINRVLDTKVYKKLIPTLKKYPEACVISIDDDFLYPRDMIADFLTVHRRYPQFPISGNRVILFEMQCHCGCASLTKAGFFGDYLVQIDKSVIDNCSSDDIVYSYFATRAGHPYIRTEKEYFLNLQSYGNDKGVGYSESVVGEDGITQTYDYLTKRYGKVSFELKRYLPDKCLSEVVCHLEKMDLADRLLKKELEVEKRLRSTWSYRTGRFLLSPMRRLHSLFNRDM